ncbi:MAG: hypothetical protein E7258_06100 [Lachnospiraceae bacterium]|nr:hypothetical protein [Lachnospiraceae bacterium]
MKRKIEFARKLLRFTYELLFVYLIVLFAEIIWIKEKPDVTLLLTVGVLYIISHLMREKVRSYLGMVFGHIILTVGVIIMGLGLSRLFLLLAIIMHLLMASLEYGYRGNKLKPLDDVPWPSFLFCVIVCIFGWGAKEMLLYKAALIIPIILLFLYYLIVYVEGVKNYVESTKDVSGLPLGNILGVNTAIVGFILFVLLVSILLGGNLDVGRLINHFVDLIVSIVKIFAFGISFVMRLVMKLMSSGSAYYELDEDGKWDDILNTEREFSYVGAVILKVFLGALAIFILWRIVKSIMKRLLIRREFQKDMVEAAEKHISKTDEEIKKKSFFRRLSPEEKIRKYYRERVLKESREIDLKHDMTCRDIEDKILESIGEDVSEITDIYVLVRYGNVVPDKELVKRTSRLSR